MSPEKQPDCKGRVTATFRAVANPFGPVCNLNCTYCYYPGKESLLQSDNKWRMTDEVLELYIRQNIGSRDIPEIIFSWQGGEPTLLGLDFFRKVVEIEKKYTQPPQKVKNDLRTNGTLLNEEWMEFLKENNWLVGLSIDGPACMHDLYRVHKDKSDTHANVMKSLKLMKTYGVEFTTLTAVNNDNARHPLAVYKFLRDTAGSKHIQFFPVVEPEGFENSSPRQLNVGSMPVMGSLQARPGRKRSRVTDWSVDPDEYGNFLCRIFDEWYKHDIEKTRISSFETLIYSALGKASPLCIFRPACGSEPILEHNGDVFSCDHFIYPDYKLGNIKETPVPIMVNSLPQIEFGMNKSRSLTRECLECEFLERCYGECPKNRIIRSSTGEPWHNYLCSGLRKFFAYTESRVAILAGDAEKCGDYLREAPFNDSF